MKLPPIHTLLNSPPSPSDQGDYQYPQHEQSLPPPGHMLPVPTGSSTLSPMASPALSSTKSPSISSIGSISPMSMKLSEFPPIHGDDPPRRLVHSPSRPSAYHQSFHHQHSFYKRHQDDVHHHDPPPAIVISPSTTTPKAEITTVTSPRPAPVPAPPPCTQILISPTTGQAILKRRRGRPPTRSPGYDEGGWTFLSPTVWDVTPSSTQPSNSQPDEMADAMAAFTSATMDTVLPMPKKKRGRKPKHHFQGNSCFVWKEITPTRHS